MKLSFWWIGKTNDKYLKEGISIYRNRLKHYVKHEIKEFREIKKIKVPEQLKVQEANLILNALDERDFLVLCDETGNHLSSVELAKYFEKWTMNSTYRRIVLLIGGAYGVTQEIKNRANFVLSLSKLTFSHQMVRLFLFEQVYRSYTIINNEKYHNI